MATPTTLATGTLAMLDALRGLRGYLGYAPIAVTVRVITTATGSGPGQGGGTPTIVDTPLLVATATGSPQNPRVVQVSERDVMASGGLYSNQMMKVGPLTPTFAAWIGGGAGGVAPGTLNPPMVDAGSSRMIYFKLSGAGFQVPVWFKRVSDEMERATRYFVVIERAGVQDPGGQP